MATTDHWIALLANNQNLFGLAFLALSAFIEYIFPPFPGDMITVFGAFLVTRRGWNGWQVFAAVTLGSVAGCATDYYVGRYLARSGWVHRRLHRFEADVNALIARFRRHGAAYLAINRFVPSMRGLFFIAAGMAPLPFIQVLCFGTLSALLWNGALFLLGTTVGSEWLRLRRIVEAYGAVALTVVLLLVGAAIARWWWRRRLNGR